MSKKWTGTPKMTDKEYEKKYPDEGGTKEYVDWVDGSTGTYMTETRKDKDKKDSIKRQKKINLARKQRIRKAKLAKQKK